MKIERKSPNPKQLPGLHSQPGRSELLGRAWMGLPFRTATGLACGVMGSSLWESMGVLPESGGTPQASPPLC